MRSWRDKALVLRHHNLGEADRIIVLFTQHHGIVRAVAKGVRRGHSRFGARLEPFTVSDVMVYPGRNLGTITEVASVQSFASRIVSDYVRYTAAGAVLEATERLVGEDDIPAPELFDLTEGVMGALASGHRPPQQIVDAFLLRAMGLAGWSPTLKDCAVCGKPGPHLAFHPAAGGVVCAEHRPSGSATPMAGVFEYLDALRGARWTVVDRLMADRQLGARLGEEAHRLVVAHLQWHTERKITALAMLDDDNT